MNNNNIKIGVYICECGINIASTVDVPKVVEELTKLEHVAAAKYYKYMCSEPGQELIKKDIKELKLDRVVVASCSPRMHEPTFRNACKEAGLNQYCFEMANIREQCSWVHENKEEATKKAFAVVKAAVARALLLEALQRKEVPVTPKALVVGGGVAGIQAAIDVADKGFKTYLVESSASIGGRMAQLDKTFPTLDCSACILTPKMVDVVRSPNIELITYAELTDVQGYIGNFKIKVRKKPRYVDVDKCVGCGECANACRLKGRINNEFDEGLGKRSAVYIPFPQAVPLKYVIDDKHCLYLTRGKCGEELLCKKACPANAIDFNQKEEIIELEVGTIIVATGYEMLDPKLRPDYGYNGKNVITGLEFERFSNASGPTSGEIIINGKKPKNVVFIQCVGSREKNKEDGNQYCSRVCCMYTAKQAHLIREKLPDANVTIFYTDVRAFGKGFEEFYTRVQSEGVVYKRRDIDDTIQVVENNGAVTVKAKGYGDINTDLVVLATAIVPRSDAKAVARILNIQQSGDGFLMEAHPKLRPLDTFTDGIFLAGCCQSPKDIPDTVAQASGAAIKASIPLAEGKVEVEPLYAVIDKNRCSGCRICEGLCAYSALKYDAQEKVMTVNDILCKGCGSCSSACPSGAIEMMHYRKAQILTQIGAMIT